MDITEIRHHWYLTYLAYEIDKLGMTLVRSDPCELVKRPNGVIGVMVALQADDSLSFVNSTCVKREEMESKHFKRNGKYSFE